MLLVSLAWAAPNFLVVMADDLDSASMANFPGISQAVSGVEFTSSFVSMSLCCPSRASFLTGQYAHSHGVLTNGGNNGGFKAFKACEDRTVARVLDDAGYRTGLFGKYANGYPGKGPETYVPAGWDAWGAMLGKDGYSQYNYSINHNGTVKSYGQVEEDYFTDVLTGLAGDFVTADPKTPFFAVVTPPSPHTPATVAPRHGGAFANASLPMSPSFNESDVSDKPSFILDFALLGTRQIDTMVQLYRSRLASMRAVEDMVVGLVDRLNTTKQLENTWVVFMSDNGFHMGEHRLSSGKNTAYEEDIRVPLLIRGPGVVAKQVDALVVNVDLAPTFLELAGLPVSSWMEGRSLVPWLLGSGVGDWRDGFLLEHFVVAEEEDGRGVQLPSFVGVRSRDWKYVGYEGGIEELYDMKNDRYELDNAIGSQSVVAARMRAWVERLKNCSGVGCREAERDK